VSLATLGKVGDIRTKGKSVPEVDAAERGWMRLDAARGATARAASATDALTVQAASCAASTFVNLRQASSSVVVMRRQTPSSGAASKLLAVRQSFSLFTVAGGIANA
jgi:hypothetical protein